MQNIIEQYKDAVVGVIGVLSGIVMLAQGCTMYRGIIEQVLLAIFYK